jgi:CRISPR-associated endonuclease/helicase Cas3
MTHEGILCLLWGKTDRCDPLRYHPLLFHMLDVANVARLLFARCVSAPVRQDVANALGVEPVEAETLVAIIAGLHDLGKCSPAFQRKRPDLAKEVEAAGLPFPAAPGDASHAWITASELPSAAAVFGASSPRTGRAALDLVARTAGAHHGTFPRSEDVVNLGRANLGNPRWASVRSELARVLAQSLCASSEPCRPVLLHGIRGPAVLPFLAGLVSVADWIGSSSEHFPIRGSSDLAEYVEMSRRGATEALTATGWLPPLQPASPLSFEGVFAFPANALQIVMARLAAQQQAPCLMIIEAPMGLGKTEAALYGADRALCSGFARGLYVAMPTQATSNAMYLRVRDGYLSRRGHSGNLRVQLAHGNARLVDEYRDLDIAPVYGGAGDGDDPVSPKSWFAARKRPLLAPFGVGTIDQSLLSVLQTRHWFVRLFGLADKVVIFDEVHAYDTYTSTLLERLLQWLSALNCTVVMLSATLPSARRQALIEAYRGGAAADLPAAPYPRITCAQGSHVRAVQVPVEESWRRTVALRYLDRLPSSLVQALREGLSEGGCAAVVCNTVARSQDVYRAVRAEFPDSTCTLFHARMPFGWRRERERQVLAMFKRGGERPRRAITVATQVIEQSLDLDFDWMASDMAPADLLLQRLGRLWRHPGTVRPTNVDHPSFTVLCDGDRGGPPPRFGESERVYERYVLLRTWLALRGRNDIQLPEDIETLVEQVYGEVEPCPPDAMWAAAFRESKQEMQEARSEAESKARKLLVAPPGDPREMVEQFSMDLAEDDDPTVHPSIQAATRLGPPSVQVVCLCESADGLSLPGEGVIPVSLDSEPDPPLTRDLLDASLPLSHRGLFHALCKLEPPKAWRRNPHLRFHRALVFREGLAEAAGYRLSLSPDLGLVIEKEEP